MPSRGTRHRQPPSYQVVKQLSRLVPALVLLAGPAAAHAEASPNSTWNTIVATTPLDEVVVVDASGATVDTFAVEGAEAFGRVVATVDDRVAIAPPGGGALTVISLADGAVEAYALGEDEFIRPLARTASVVTAATRDGYTMTIVDVARGNVLEMGQIWPRVGDAGRFYTTPLVDDASTIAVVSDSLAHETMVISLDDQTTTTIDGSALAIIGDSVATVLVDEASTATVSFWGFDGVLQDSVTLPEPIARINAVGHAIVAVTQQGELFEVVPGSPDVRPIGHIDNDEDTAVYGIAPLAGARFMIVTDGAIHIVSSNGDDVRTVTDLEDVRMAASDLTDVSRCVATGEVVVDTATGELLPASGRVAASADRCTYVAEFAPLTPDRIIRDGTTIELPEDARVQAISPDGTHAIVYDTEAEAFHLVDLDAPSELGPALDVGEPGATFTFIQR